MAIDVKHIDSMLPYLLQRDNVARYEDGRVIIGDRRKYPFEKTSYPCDDIETVARAIEDMVTQGGGPWLAAAYGMVMAAHDAAGKQQDDALDYLQKAQQRLINTRPTNTALARRMEDALEVATRAVNSGESAEETLLKWIDDIHDDILKNHAIRARLGANLIDDGDGILTMCFAESSFLLTLAMAKEDGKDIRVFTPETRPFLQGARLTAPCIHELDIHVQIITDNMPAHVMSEGKVQKYMTAADLITLDGHVVNKIGTFQNAIAANYHHIPYYAFMWMVDHKSPDRESVVIEHRDPADIRGCREATTTISDIDAYYPAFDITPPHLVAGIITAHGVLSPYDLKRHYVEGDAIG